MSGVEPRVLIVTDKSDLAETHLILGLHRAGLDIQVACNPEGPHFARLKAAGIVAGELALTGRFDRPGTALIRRLVDARKTNVVHCFNPRALACALRATRGRAVKILAYRGVIGNIGIFNPESWITFLHPRLDRIVCVSDAVRAYLLKLNLPGGRLAPEKVVRIYKGHDLGWYSEPAADLSAMDFPDAAFVVCCTGRDRPGKGFGTLLEAMDLIPASCPVHLLLVGNLQENKELVNQVSSLRCKDRVRFAGYRTDAPQVAAACDALVLASESEGLPRVVIEAMAYARPVVVTDAGGMPEIVRDGVEGYVVPVRNPVALADALIRLETDRAAAAEMGRRGRQRIGEAFTLGAGVQATLALYRELACEFTPA